MVEIGQDKPYRELMQVFARHPVGCYESETFIEILKFYYEPEEAHLAAHMAFEMEPEEAIAKRAGVSLNDAASLLTRMASKFFVRGIKRTDGVRVFRLPFIVPGLFELPFAVRQTSPELDHLGDLWEKYFEEGWGRELNGGPIQLVRALPSTSAPKEQVMPYEDAVEVVKQAAFATINPCMCRQTKRGCGDPLDVCLLLGMGFYGGDVPGQTVLDPAQMVSTPRGRIAPLDEVVQVLKRSEEAGLIHLTLNVQGDPWLICNCCRHACHALRGITQLDIPHAVAPSSYWCTVDEDLCTGCWACIDRCPVSAIEMKDGMVVEVDIERCLGCGVCTSICSPEALRLEKRDPDRILTPMASEHELFVMRAASKNKPYPVHPH